MEQEQPGTTASPGEAAESRWRKLFASTGAPPAWGLVRYMVCGLVLGGALGAALPEFRGALLAALTGAVVAASGSGGPSGVSRRVALISAGAGLALTVVAFATGNYPVWAALAMAAVAILTSLAAAAGPLGALLGFLGSLAYFLVATMARVANLYELVSLGVGGRPRRSRGCPRRSDRRLRRDGVPPAKHEPRTTSGKHVSRCR